MINFGWCGELGWEITTAIPFINGLFKAQHEITVHTFGGSIGLYSDMCEEMESGLGDNQRVCGRGKDGYFPIPKNMMGDNWYIPCDRRTNCHVKVKSIPKEIREDIQPGRQNQVAVHARHFHRGKSGRNFKEYQLCAVEEFKRLGYDIVFIGHPQFSLYYKDYGIDKRSDYIVDTITELKKSILLFGPDSGPTHLAHWCKTPAFSWGCGDLRNWVVPGGNRWNPFEILHFHPWSGNETEENLYKYRKQSYKPTNDELLSGVRYMIKELGM